MKRSLPGVLIAIFVIALTIFVGVLGARGASSANRVASTRPSLVVAPSDLQRPAHRAALIGSVTSDQTVPVPVCEGRITIKDAALSFLCPADWYVWENDAFHDGVPQSLGIISNRKPLVEGGEGLPDGWFKVDMYVMRPAHATTVAGLAADMCSDRTASGRIDSCDRVTIAGRVWVSLVCHDQEFGAENHVVATIVDGVRYDVVGMVPDGPSAARGRAQLADLFSSLRIA
jgi:hypothetical protein